MGLFMTKPTPAPTAPTAANAAKAAAAAKAERAANNSNKQKQAADVMEEMSSNGNLETGEPRTEGGRRKTRRNKKNRKH